MRSSISYTVKEMRSTTVSKPTTTPLHHPGFQRRRNGMRCAASEENAVDRLITRIQREMLKHVDIAPKPPPTERSYESLPEEQIKKAERFMLDGWSSTQFHATGVVVAFLLAILMILNSPLSTPHS